MTMDYVVGSVAALISGNVTPNRPNKSKKPFTPIKHQLSPNVTPKSELVEDRSIFLSPTMQKKKAIVKKSPKRIFQNPDLDVTKESDGNSSLTSPKADKVKKHLKDQLDADAVAEQIMLSPKSPENGLKEQSKNSALKKKQKNNGDNTSGNIKESTPKNKKNKRKLEDKSDLMVPNGTDLEAEKENEITNTEVPQNGSPKKKKKRSKSAQVDKPNNPPVTNNDNNQNQAKKKKKNKQKGNPTAEIKEDAPPAVQTVQSSKKKNKKKKNKKSKTDNNVKEATSDVNINMNAVTNKDSDSEHESDDEIESESDDINKKALEPATADDSSDDEEVEPKKQETKIDPPTEEEIKRTIFVGNVPFSSKCKKEIKKIFSHYGDIETVRIRTVPVKDARVTPKLAVIKNELHPDRSTVNVYIKFVDISSVDKALAANNTVLNNHHLRVTRSNATGVEHDPKCSIFVGNIPFALEDEGLRVKFEKCGEIESVRIIRDRKTNAGKGFGYVNFTSKDGVELALALTEEDLTIKNRILRVKRCTQPTERKANRPDPRNKVGYQGRPNPGQIGKGGFQGRQNDDKNTGAFRRMNNKRKNQDGNEGPPNKRQNMNQPFKEKKVRKEFVGITAEKKKKQKFDKGQKKKKALSEILTKK